MCWFRFCFVFSAGRSKISQTNGSVDPVEVSSRSWTLPLSCHLTMCSLLTVGRVPGLVLDVSFFFFYLWKRNCKKRSLLVHKSKRKGVQDRRTPAFQARYSKTTVHTLNMTWKSWIYTHPTTNSQIRRLLVNHYTTFTLTYLVSEIPDLFEEVHEKGAIFFNRKHNEK